MKKKYSLRFKVTAITVGVVLAAILSAAGLCFTVLQRESDRRSGGSTDENESPAGGI